MPRLSTGQRAQEHHDHDDKAHPIVAPAAAVDPNAANLEVRLPENATLWIQGQQAKETGAVRHFVSPPLANDQTFTYDLHANWTDANGKTIERTKKVEVKAGAWIGVDFNRQDK